MADGQPCAPVPDDDPRLDASYVRRVALDEDVLVLVGAVHDHPASTYRVRRVVESVAPAVVGVELPPLAVPLYRGDDTVAVAGGEMSAAVDVAESLGATVAGVDAPTVEFAWMLARRCYREDASRATVRRVVERTWTVTRRAAACRLAAVAGARGPLRDAVDRRVDHDCDPGNDAGVQAADERRQVEQSRAVMDALGTPRPVELCETTREDHMARRLVATSDRADGDAVGVVGVDHLDPVADAVGDLTA